MKNLFDLHKFSLDEFRGILLANYGEANTTLKWKASDMPDKFKMCSDDRKLKYWTGKDLEYRYNNYGFRSDDNFNKDDEGVVTLGCSFTEGIGLPIEYNWGYKVAKYLNLKHWNLGQGGMGLHTAYRLLLGASQILNFKKVFLFTPPLYRKEYIIEDNKLLKDYFLSDKSNHMNILHSLGNDINSMLWFKFEDKKYDDFAKAWLYGSEKDTVMDQVRTLCAIKGLCSFLNVELYYQSFYEYFSSEANEKSQNIPDSECPDIPPRDDHWGAKKQHLIYKNFINIYENNNG